MRDIDSPLSITCCTVGNDGMGENERRPIGNLNVFHRIGVGNGSGRLASKNEGRRVATEWKRNRREILWMPPLKVAFGQATNERPEMTKLASNKWNKIKKCMK